MPGKQTCSYEMAAKIVALLYADPGCANVMATQPQPIERKSCRSCGKVFRPKRSSALWCSRSCYEGRGAASCL